MGEATRRKAYSSNVKRQKKIKKNETGRKRKEEYFEKQENGNKRKKKKELSNARSKKTIKGKETRSEFKMQGLRIWKKKLELRKEKPD